MLFLLDTNVISDLMRPVNAIEGWFAVISSEHRIVTCPIVRGEVLFGVSRLSEGKRKADLLANAQRVLSGFDCVNIPAAAADIYATLKRSGQVKGKNLDENDLWIAATALAVGATLVTRDRDFSEVEGLQVLNPAEAQ